MTTENTAGMYPKKPKATFYKSEKHPQAPLGSYTFRVMPIVTEGDERFRTFKTSPKGNSYAKVSLRAEWDGHNVYENASFMFMPRFLPKLADFVEACTGSRPTLAAIETKVGFRAQIEKCVGCHVKATVRLREPDPQGRVFAELVDFRPDIAPVAETQARSTSPKPAALEAADTDDSAGVPF